MGVSLGYYLCKIQIISEMLDKGLTMSEPLSAIQQALSDGQSCLNEFVANNNTADLLLLSLPLYWPRFSSCPYPGAGRPGRGVYRSWC